MIGYRERKIKKTCPKCGSSTFTIYEESLVTREIEIEQGVIAYEGPVTPTGDIVRVTCECYDCGHRWRPRRTCSNKTFFELVKEGGAE